MTISLKPVLAVLAALVLAAGCAPSNTATTYTREQMNREAMVETGTVVSMRPVTVEGTGRTGGLVGGVAGGVGGSFIGGDWRSNLLAGLGGAVLGGVAGSAAERSMTTTTATEFIVELEGGGTIAVVQSNEQGLRVGDRVTILRGDRTRLTPRA